MTPVTRLNQRVRWAWSAKPTPLATWAGATPAARSCRARHLLAAGASPAQVSTAVGFADQAHLTRWFKRVTGVTPAAYRKSVQDPVRIGV